MEWFYWVEVGALSWQLPVYWSMVCSSRNSCVILGLCGVVLLSTSKIRTDGSSVLLDFISHRSALLGLLLRWSGQAYFPNLFCSISWDCLLHMPCILQCKNLLTLQLLLTMHIVNNPSTNFKQTQHSSVKSTWPHRQRFQRMWSLANWRWFTLALSDLFTFFVFLLTCR